MSNYRTHWTQEEIAQLEAKLQQARDQLAYVRKLCRDDNEHLWQAQERIKELQDCGQPLVLKLKGVEDQLRQAQARIGVLEQENERLRGTHLPNTRRWRAVDGRITRPRFDDQLPGAEDDFRVGQMAEWLADDLNTVLDNHDALTQLTKGLATALHSLSTYGKGADLCWCLTKRIDVEEHNGFCTEARAAFAAYDAWVKEDEV